MLLKSRQYYRKKFGYRYSKHIFAKCLILLICLNLFFTPIFSSILNFSLVQPVAASSLLSYEEQPALNVFSSQYGSGHNRRFVAVGDFFDTVVNAYYGRSETYLKFNVTLPAGAIIQNAQLSMRRYANAGSNFDAKVGKLTQNFDASTGSTINDFKTHSGIYAITNIDSNNLDFRDYRWDISALIQKWISGQPNYGLAVYSDTNSANRGAAFCGIRNDSFCTSAYNPKLIISYMINQPPYSPALLSPANMSKFTSQCDESVVPVTSQCRVKMNLDLHANNVGDGDPAPGDLKNSRFVFQGANNFNSQDITNSGDITYSGQFTDGVTSWFVNSTDNLNANTDSTSFIFTTDSTPPSIPMVPSLPQFLKGVDQNVQLQIPFQSSTDNVSSRSDLSYELEYSQDRIFPSNSSFTKPWQNQTIFELGPNGIDQIPNNSDDIIDGHIYYFRLKAKDSPNSDTGNISNWSNIISTTIDNTAPAISNFSSTDTRFSPNNSTSLGIKDSISFNLKYSELNVDQDSVEIYSDSQKQHLVRTLTSPTNACQSTNCVEKTYFWNGKDDNGAYLADGVYYTQAEAIDKAENVSISSPILLIIDNTGANIAISSPIENFWTNNKNIIFNGQVTVPRDPTKQDADVSSLQVQNGSLGWKNLAYDGNNFFTYNSNITGGVNLFSFRTVDTVANQIEIQRRVNLDTNLPIISNIQPASLTNNTKSQISYVQSDLGNAISGTYTGTNPHNSKIKLDYDYLDNGEIKHAQKILINNGVNVAPELVSDLKCDTPNSLYNHNGFTASDTSNCSLNFIADLQPDAKYTTTISIEDVAGNSSSQSQDFTLDSHIYSSLSSPKDGALYSSSSIQFSGIASKSSVLKIKNDALNRNKSFTLNESLNGSGQDDVSDPQKLLASNSHVNCGKFLDIDNNLATPDEEVCDWSVRVYQKYSQTNADTQNQNVIITSDTAGNISSIQKNININLFKFDLTISSDLNFFSPNGDGNQDGIKFTENATNSTDRNFAPEIKSYNLKIINLKNDSIAREFFGNDMPQNIFWDGKDQRGDWIADGDYAYTIEVITTDGAIVSTQQQMIFARTKVITDVVITSPRDNFITTDGVISLQGQAPSQDMVTYHGKVFVNVCVDTVGTNIECDFSETVEANQNGYFSTLVVLPRTSQPKIIQTITAKAHDEYGNVTQNSNIVHVIQDSIDPFQNVYITPSLTGINTKEDYEKFLLGEISINKLRTLTLHASVTQNTEQLQYSFASVNNDANHNILNNIAIVNNLKETDPRLNPQNLESIKHNYNLSSLTPVISHPCDSSLGCYWETYLALSSDWGGFYTVEFKAQKGQNIQSLYAGFKADGSLPAAPLIMTIEKWKDNNWTDTTAYNRKYYTNLPKLRLRGAAEPNSILQLQINNSNYGNTFTASASGIWENDISNLASLPMDCSEKNLNKCDFGELNFKIIATKDYGNGQVTSIPSSNNADVIYDIVTPKINSILRITPDSNIAGWEKTGDNAQFNISSNKTLAYANLQKEDGFISQMNSIDIANQIWNGSINIDRKNEGYYNPTIMVQDLAGNTITYDSKNYYQNNLQDWRIYIDNTKPESTHIDTSKWQTDSGIKADGINPEIGRTNPFYAIKSNQVTLMGKAEKNQRVEIWVNNVVKSIVPVNNNCIIQTRDTITPDEFVEKYGSICDWQYSYNFDNNGANDNFGLPINAYIFQTRVRDSAANFSEFSNQEIIYLDHQAPAIPKIMSTSIGESTVTSNLSISFNIDAERFADMQFSKNLKTNGAVMDQVKESLVYKNSSDRKSNQSFSLGTKSDDRNGCVQIKENKRVGMCEDGFYKFNLTATDAAGNMSPVSTKIIERDTVSPSSPDLELSLCEQGICANVVGENGTDVYVNGKRNTKLYSNSQKIVIENDPKEVKEYAYGISLVDDAGNISPSVHKTIFVEHPRGGIEGASAENPYASMNGNTLPQIGMEVDVYPDTKDYHIINYNIPAPTLTWVYTQSNKKVEINGLSIEPGHKLIAKLHIHYLSYNEAKKKCHFSNNDNLNENDKKCISDYIGISYDDWKKNKDNECKMLFVTLPFCTPNAMSTVQNSDEVKEITVSQVRNEISKYTFVSNLNSPIFHLSSSPFILGNSENPDTKGEFTYKHEINNDLQSAEYVQARTQIMGDFQYKDVKISYSGIAIEEAKKNSGLFSDYGNHIKVDDINYKIIQGKKAVVLDVPYFNQNLDMYNRRDKSPWYGGQVCGAASATMVAGYYKKLEYNPNDTTNTLRPYVFLNNPSKDPATVTKQLESIPKGVCDQGTYGVTRIPGPCTGGSYEKGIKDFLNNLGLKTNEINEKYRLREEIDKGHPVIMSLTSPIDHLLVITGYILDSQNLYIVDDPYRDIFTNANGNYDNSGNQAIYDLSSKKFEIYYFLSIQ